jgi:hypothetical protein
VMRCRLGSTGSHAHAGWRWMGEGEISTGKGGEQRVSSCREVGV